MKSISDILNNNFKREISPLLKDLYRNNKTLSNEDIIALNNFETFDYDLNGIIGLLINSKARIALGKKQPFDKEIQDWCKKIEITFEDFKIIANKYLEDDFKEEPEHILRYVMLEYPYNPNT